MNAESNILQIAIEDLVSNKHMPRKIYYEESLNTLAESIKQYGIISPLLVRRLPDGKYEIVSGERRYRAAQKVNLTSVPAIITTMTDQQAAEIALTDNMTREELSPIDQAKNYKSLIDNGSSTVEDLANKLGVTPKAINDKLKLLTLTQETQMALLNKKISERHARSLLKVTDQAKQVELLNRTINEKLTVKQLDDAIIGLQGDVPIINNQVNPEFIKNNAKDISAGGYQQPAQQYEEQLMSDNQQSAFFNPLENYSANMSTVAPPPPSIQVQETQQPVIELETLDGEEIEGLDAFAALNNKDKTQEIINAVKMVLQNKNGIVLNERDYGNEYQLNITIKKDEANK